MARFGTTTFTRTGSDELDADPSSTMSSDEEEEASDELEIAEEVIATVARDMSGVSTAFEVVQVRSVRVEEKDHAEPAIEDTGDEFAIGRIRGCQNWRLSHQQNRIERDLEDLESRFATEIKK